MSQYQLTSLCGLFFMIGVAYLLSAKRSAVRWKPVMWGVGLQFMLAIIVLKTKAGSAFFAWVNDIVLLLISYQQVGGELVFGALSIPPGSPGSMGFFFAFQVLTTIIFFSALISVLYYVGVMQLVMTTFARVMRRLMGTSGAETLSASANIFVGQTEAPLLVRPYLKEMTQSELLCVMIAGMATIAGGAMGAYAGMLNGYFPNIAGHLLAASLMSAPAAIAVSKLLMPETGDPVTLGEVKLVHHGEKSTNVLEAAASGAETGMQMALNVGTMLIAFMALLALVNGLLGWAASLAGYHDVSLQMLLGYICAPLAWIMGAPWEECITLGRLIGEKTVINEFVAFMSLSSLLREGGTELSERSLVILTYALSGFSNFMSIGIQIGGIGAIVPERKSDLARLGVRALIGGSLACFMTACIAGFLL